MDLVYSVRENATSLSFVELIHVLSLPYKMHADDSTLFALRIQKIFQCWCLENFVDEERKITHWWASSIFRTAYTPLVISLIAIPNGAVTIIEIAIYRVIQSHTLISYLIILHIIPIYWWTPIDVHQNFIIVIVSTSGRTIIVIVSTSTSPFLEQRSTYSKTTIIENLFAWQMPLRYLMLCSF